MDHRRDADGARKRVSAIGRQENLVRRWECTAGKFQWIFGWDEFVHIQEGEAIIQEEGGKTVTLRRGDLAHFPKGLKTVWTVPNFVRKVFTLRTDEPLVM